MELRPRSPGDVIAEGVERSFSDRPVLRGVSFSVPSGGTTAIVGPNGSGKTTLLRIVAGVLQQDAGRVSVAGADPGRGGSAFVPAGDRSLHWRLTAAANLEFFCAVARVGRPRDGLVHAAAAMVGGEDLLGQRIGQCSTGQRRRLMLASALVTGAPVLVLDEPHADLDADGRHLVDDACRAWTANGGCVIYATAEGGEGPVADRVVLLDASRDVGVSR